MEFNSLTGSYVHVVYENKKKNWKSFSKNILSTDQNFEIFKFSKCAKILKLFENNWKKPSRLKKKTHDWKKNPQVQFCLAKFSPHS